MLGQEECCRSRQSSFYTSVVSTLLRQAIWGEIGRTLRREIGLAPPTRG